MTLTRAQRVILWATLSLSAVPVLYPHPSHFLWRAGDIFDQITDGQGSGGWINVDSDSYRRIRERYSFTDDRRFLYDLELYGQVRPNFARMIMESSAIIAVGIGLVIALKQAA